MAVGYFTSYGTRTALIDSIIQSSAVTVLLPARIANTVMHCAADLLFAQQPKMACPAFMTGPSWSVPQSLPSPVLQI
jgi:hypothetical protein